MIVEYILMKTGLETRIMPIAELPSVDADVVTGQEFWSCRNLRPDATDNPGPNFNNIPALGLTMRFVDEVAVLTVPSMDYVNSVIEDHNPGGFRFEAAEGIVPSEEFLGMVADKTFPWSTDACSSIRRSGFVPLPECITNPEAMLNLDLETNSLEHTLAHHLGIAALLPSAANRTARFAARYKKKSPDQQYQATDVVDTTLDYLSAYCTLPFESEDPLINDVEKKIKEEINGKRVVRFSLQDRIVLEESIPLNYRKIRAKAQEMQSLPAPE